MKTIEVVEPAMEDKAKGAQNGDGGCVVVEVGFAVVEVGDELKFPHIDSCLGIAGILSDGRILGAHVGRFTKTNEPVKNLLFESCRLLGEAAVKANKEGVAIAKAIFIGDDDWQDKYQVVTSVCDDFDIGISHFFRKPKRLLKGVDVCLNGKDQKVKIYPSEGGNPVVNWSLNVIDKGHKGGEF